MLYNTVEAGATGRVLCAIFFLGLIFAGISSLIAIMEMGVHVLNDFGSESIERGESVLAQLAVAHGHDPNF